MAGQIYSGVDKYHELVEKHRERGLIALHLARDLDFIEKRDALGVIVRNSLFMPGSEMMDKCLEYSSDMVCNDHDKMNFHVLTYKPRKKR